MVHSAPEQDPLFGDGRQPASNLQRRAFGSVPRLLNCGEVSAPSDTVEPLVDVPNLQTTLYQQHDSDQNGFIVEGLVLNSQEYTDVVRRPQSMLRAVGAKTIASRELRGDMNVDRIDHRQLMSQMYAVFQKGTVHNRRITQFVTEIGNLQKLGSYARSPGYARTTEVDLRMLATEVWMNNFMDILEVASMRSNWDGETQKLAEDAMAYRLTEGPQRERIGYWQGMIGLAEQYATRKRLLFIQRRNTLRSEYLALNKQLQKQNELFLNTDESKE